MHIYCSMAILEHVLCYRHVVEEIGEEDLLGLSNEGVEKKYPLQKLQELFKGQSGNITSSRFSPSW